MKSVDLLKKEFKALSDTTEIVDVMKKIALSRFGSLDNKSKSKVNSIKQSLAVFLSMVDITGSTHPFLKEPQFPILTIVLITSDEGFVGGLNSQILKRALEIKKKRNSELIVIGERGSNYLEDLNESFRFFPGISEDITITEVNKIKDYLINQFLNQKMGEIIFIYPRFISFSHQEVEVSRLIPCNYIFPSSKKNMGSPDGIERRSGKDRRLVQDRRLTEPKQTDKQMQLSQSRRKNNNGRRSIKSYRRSTENFFYKEELLLEPNLNRITDYLVNLWIDNKIFNILKESKLSEFAARAINLEGSFQEFSRKTKKLKHKYLKGVHESVDKSIREVFACKSLWEELE